MALLGNVGPPANPSWRNAVQVVLTAFGIRVLVSSGVWLMVDDWAGRGWSTGDFYEWATAVVAGGLLALALAHVIFFGYAIVSSS